MDKKQILLNIISFIICTVASAQQQKPSISDSSLIIKLENDWAKALVNRDASVFRRLLADDFFYTENDKMYSRADVLDAAMSETDTVESAYNKEMVVHLKGKTGIVTGCLFVNGRSKEGVFKRKYKFTDIWYNENGSWKLIAAQDYLLP